jgi:hypothetical protein
MKGCLNVPMHNLVTLDGEKYHGRVFFEKRFHSCDKPDCPICFKRGWAVDEATRAEERFTKFSSGYVDKEDKKHAGLGLAEHIIVSIPVFDYGLDFPELKKKCIRLVEALGVLGGLLIFHVSRYRNAYEAAAVNEPMGWYFSPHWHILGYIDGGYGRCRRCKKSRVCCMSCSGFEGRARRFNSGVDGKGKGKGYIFKVKDKRKTIHGTLWYQMNHAAFVRGKRENRVVFWFGVCSYRKAKMVRDKSVHEKLCPCCGSPLEHIVYVGEPEGNPLNEWYCRSGWSDFLDERGVPRWVLKNRG